MKDKEKQIEEMAKVIKCANEINCIRTCDTCNYYDDDSKCISFGQAIALYEQGYRKIPKDSVVLSREEYNKMRFDLVELRNQVNLFEVRNMPQARKETAENIISELVMDGSTFTINRLTLLANKYDLDIKEILRSCYGK